MAPRGRRRPRKRGNTRMNAALDAMSPLGFSEKCVRQTVKELLKVYGGDDGWVFIEEAAYKLLIETILDDQKNASPERDAALDDARSINDTNTSIAGPSCAVIESNCSEIAAVDTELLTAADVTVNSVSQGTESLDFQAPNFGVIELNCSDIVAVNAELLTVADDTLDSESHGAEALDFQAQTNEAGNFDSPVKFDEYSSPESSKLQDLNGKHLCVKDSETDKDHSSAIIQSPKTASLFSPQKRKPYHGWISNDEEDDFMYLMPEPLPEALKKCLRLNKKRIQRWDLRPEDVYGSHLSPAPPCS